MEFHTVGVCVCNIFGYLAVGRWGLLARKMALACFVVDLNAGLVVVNKYVISYD